MPDLLEPALVADEAAGDVEHVAFSHVEGDLPPTPMTISIHVDPHRLLKVLATIILIVVCVSIVAHTFLGATGEDELRAVRQVAMRFDMDRENTLCEWFSSLLLVSCALVLGSIGLRHRRGRQPFAWHWLFLSLVFVYLSIDESVGMHEILMVPLRRRLGTSGVFHFAWVIVALPLVVAMFFAYLRFLWRLQPTTRWLFILAGCLYVGGALGMEMIGGALVDSSGYFTATYTLVMTIEEACEMLGASLFLCSLLAYRVAMERDSFVSPTSVLQAT